MKIPNLNTLLPPAYRKKLEATITTVKRQQRKKVAIDDFIARSKEVHNNKYDYSRVVDCRANEKVEIICPEHGSFWQYKHNHVAGQKCYHCTRDSRTVRVETFIKRLKEVHGDSLTYVGGYSAMAFPVSMHCNVCGHDWETAPAHMIYHQTGCPICAMSELVGARTKPDEVFREQLWKVRDGQFKLIGTYTRGLDNNTFQCTNCGHEFMTTPRQMLRGKKCPSCRKG